MSKRLVEDVEKILAGEAVVKLDPVGKEDSDIDNDGDKDKTDSYLAKRRKTISAAIAASKKTDKLTDAYAEKIKNILLGEAKKKEEMKDEEEDEEEKEDEMNDEEGDESDDKKKMKKEEVEQVDEITKKTASSYIAAANKKLDNPETSTAKALRIHRGLELAMKKKYPGEMSGKPAKIQATREEVEQVDEMEVANKYALKGPQPAEVPAYMRKGNARKQFPLKLDDLKRKDTMSDVENLRKMEDVEVTVESLELNIPQYPSYQDYVKAALRLSECSSFSELIEEEQQYIISEMETAYKENDISFIIEADNFYQMQQKAILLSRQGHKIDTGRDDEGNPFYIQTDKNTGIRRKVTFKGDKKIEQPLGRETAPTVGQEKESQK